MSCSWSVEFGPDFTPPAEILALVDSKELEDLSWHNDMCPSFGWQDDADITVRLWCDAAIENDREFGDTERYNVTLEDHRTGSPLWHVQEALFEPFYTDDIQAAIARYREVLTAVRASLQPA